MISVLYIDDEPDLLDIGKLFLEEGGQIHVDTALSAADASVQMQSNVYDAIISDYQMPGMDGIEFLKTVRASGNIIPFIIFTGKGREEVVIQALNEGADFYLQKGGDPMPQFTELQHQVTIAVQHRRAEQALEEREHELRESEADLLEAQRLAKIGSWRFDIPSNTITWSEELYRIFEIEKTAFGGEYNFFLHQVHPDDTPRVLETNRKAREGEGPFEVEYRIVTREGRLKYIREVGYSTKNARGEVVGLFGTAQDITARKRTEEELRSSHERLQLTLKAAHAGTWDWDMPSGTLTWSPEMYDLFGLPPGTPATFEAFLSAVHPKDRETAMAKIDQSVNDHTLLWNEYRVLHPGGKELWIGAAGSTTYSDSGTPLRMSGVCIDISHRKSVEAALQRDLEAMKVLQRLSRSNAASGNLSELLTDIVDAAIGITSADFGNIQMLDPKTGRLRIVAQRNLPDWWLAFWETVIEGKGTCGTALASEERVIVPDVEKSPIFIGTPALEIQQRAGIRAVQSTPLRSRDGRIIGMFSTHFKKPYEPDDRQIQLLDLLASQAVDLIEQNRYEAELRKSEERFRLLATNTTDVIWTLDLAGRFTYVSPSIERLLGYTAEEFVHQAFDTALTPAYAEMVRDEFGRALEEIHEGKNPSEFRGELEQVRKDGSIIWTEIISKSLFNEHNELIGIIGVSRDITDRKRIEDALRKANRQINLLTSITRHDIKNKLMVVLGHVGIAEKAATDPKLARSLEKIRSSMEAIRSQIEFTKIYEDLGSNEPVWQGLDSVLHREEVPKAISLNSIVTGVEVFADPMLEKVVYNLLDNSIQHGDHVTEIRVSSQLGDQGLKIIWEDNGIGIPVDQKEKIFERGYGKNTGLGLFLVREILSLTGITIKENGEPGKGARFEILVPKGMYRLRT